MKKIILPGVMLIFISIIITGCTEKVDPSGDPSTRDNFLGKWSVSESWTKLTYEVTITADPGTADGVFISNFANTTTAATPAAAVVNGNSIILDPDQVISGLTINGSGVLTGTRINWNYTLFDGADLINSVAIYSKQ
jgi:hypothetical protein